jgi:hypothetical protein
VDAQAAERSQKRCFAAIRATNVGAQGGPNDLSDSLFKLSEK